MILDEIIFLDQIDLSLAIKRLSSEELLSLPVQAVDEALLLQQKEASGDKVSALLSFAVTALIEKGEQILLAMDTLAQEEKEVAFKSWNDDMKSLAKRLRMPHDIEEELPSWGGDFLQRQAIMCAQSFSGGNPGVEMFPDYAQERRLEAFNIMVLCLQSLKAGSK